MRRLSAVALAKADLIVDHLLTEPVAFSEGGRLAPIELRLASHPLNNLRGGPCCFLPRFVNNSEQFAADLFDRLAERSVEHLRVHIQRRVDVGVTHQLRDNLAWHASVVRPR